MAGVGLGVVASCGLVAAWAEAVCRPAVAAVSVPGPATPAAALTASLAVAALLLGSWVTLGAALEVLTVLPGRAGTAAGRWSARVGPPLVRRGVAVLLGAGLAASAGSAASAGTAGASVAWPEPGFRPPGAVSAPAAPPSAPGGTDAPTATTATAMPPSAPGGTHTPTASSVSATPAPGWTPTTPPVRPQPTTSLLTRTREPRTEEEVVVRRGDTLWTIAAR
ncbi:MAG TPA: hypothetical protein VES95_10450, partial [Dermatophilaceae bacterium]|nr:hypothetical protein [Dermatophilaceae bacterium]